MRTTLADGGARVAMTSTRDDQEPFPQESCRAVECSGDIEACVPWIRRRM